METRVWKRYVACFCLLLVSCEPTKSMIRQISDSRSLILRASHILHVRVDGVRAPEWGTEPIRTADVTVEIVQVFKGEMQGGGQTAHFAVRQVRPQPDGPSLPATDCWSRQPLLPGSEWVVFSKTQASTLAEILNDPACLRLVPADAGLIDVRIAAKLETELLSLPAIVPVVKPGADRLHELFVDYLAARFAELNLDTRENLDSVLDLVEAPRLPAITRTALLNAVRSYVESSQHTGDWNINRIAITMFRLLLLHEAQHLHENLIGTYLPNLLGLTGGSGKRSARAVFHDWPKDRASAQSALVDYRGPASTDALLAWLRE